jgi:hypothetical protein
MSLKITTSTGVREVVDLKVMTAKGTPVDVKRLVIKTGANTVKTIWEREVPDPDPDPDPDPPVPPVGVDPLILTVNAHDGKFTIPVSNSNSYSFDWIIVWGDGQVSQATNNTSKLTHVYTASGTYAIQIYPSSASATGWLRRFGTTRGSHFNPETDRYEGDVAIPTPSVQNNLDKIVIVDGVITPQMVATAVDIAQGKVGNSVCNHWFYGCRNLTMSDTFTFAGWEDITEVGGGFCYGMFFGCSSNNFTMGAAFNLSQNIQKIGGSGANYRYPNWHQVPAHAFCNCMFYGCSGANFNMNDVCSLPQTLIMTGAWFCTSMFRNCSGNAFTMGAAFNLPQNVTKLAAPENNRTMGHVCENMFRNCHGTAFNMNSIFQLPQGLLLGGLNTFFQMFGQCYGNSFTMNPIITLPQAMTDTSSGFANSMFSQCHGSGFQVGSAFKFPPLLSQATVDKSNNFLRVFYCWTNKTYHRQNRTIASIINGLPTPSMARGTFLTFNATQGANRWSDFNDPGIGTNWTQ